MGEENFDYQAKMAEKLKQKETFKVLITPEVKEKLTDFINAVKKQNHQSNLNANDFEDKILDILIKFIPYNIDYSVLDGVIIDAINKLTLIKGTNPIYDLAFRLEAGIYKYVTDNYGDYLKFLETDLKPVFNIFKNKNKDISESELNDIFDSALLEDLPFYDGSEKLSVYFTKVLLARKKAFTSNTKYENANWLKIQEKDERLLEETLKEK